MKAHDDITWDATDTVVANAELDFEFDARPLVAGETGAGVFSCTCGKANCYCDMGDGFDMPDSTNAPAWYTEAGF